MKMSADRIEKTVSWLKNIAAVKNNSKAADLLAYIEELEQRVNTLEYKADHLEDKYEKAYTDLQRLEKQLDEHELEANIYRQGKIK